MSFMSGVMFLGIFFGVVHRFSQDLLVFFFFFFF